MKKFLLPLLVLPILFAFSFLEKNELPLGTELPMAEHKVQDISGKWISLKEATLKNGLLVMFSCNTCPYVIKNQGRTQKIAKEALQQQVGVVLLNSNEGTRNGDDSFDAMKKYAASQQYRWYYVVDKDSKLADAFGAKRTPECYLFNRRGRLVYQGAIDDNPSNAGSVKRTHLAEAMAEMVAGKDVTVTQSRSIGCGIKRKS